MRIGGEAILDAKMTTSVVSYSQLGHIARLLTDRVLPASFFAVVLAAKSTALFHYLQNPRDDLTLSVSLILSQATAIAFTAVAVLLILMRRGVTGERARLPQIVIALGGSFILTALALSPPSTTGAGLHLLGDLIVSVGLGFAAVALISLGRCFGILPEARGLVTRGPYRYVRHPIYVGEFIFAIGMLLPVFSPSTITVFFLFALLQLQRAVYEESALEKAFPKYADYKRATWRFIPKVY